MRIKDLPKRRAVCAVLFTLLLSVAGVTNATAQSFTVGDFTYSFNDDGASVTLTGHVDGISGQLVIPESVELYGTSYPVTAIGEYAFQYCYDLTGDLVIPNSVITIGRGAFYSCPSFTGSLIIGDAVQSIGFDAFSECYGFTGSLNVGNSVQTIGGYAFHNCSGFTGSLTIGNSVQTIDQNAFSGCTGFTGSLAIGNAVQTIGYDAFLDCSGFTGSLVIGNSVQTIGEYAFGNCSGFTGSLTISESVTQINYLAFYNCNGFTSLDYNAVNCNLYGSGWGGYHWLEYCSSLTTLTIGENVHVIPDNFLKDHSSLLGDLVIPNTVTTISENAFYGCSGFTGSLNIPNSVTTISNSAFYGCSGFTGSLTIGNAVTTIGENAFNGCSGFTGSLTIPNSVTTIGSSAFLNCSGFSGTLTLGNSLTQIDNSAFFGACENITSFEVWAETPPALGNYVFLSANTGIPVYVPCSTLEAYQNTSDWSGFTNLQEFNPCQWSIGATVYHATGGTVNGAGIYEQGQTCTLTATPFSGFVFSRWTEDGEVVSTDATYSFVVEGNRNLVAYFTSPDFIVFADPNVEARCIELWDSNGDGYLSYDEAAAVTSLNYAFRNWSNITSFDELQYFTGLTSINDWEMSGCGNLTSIVLPESLTSINYAAFEYSYSLQSIVIPESVAYIGGWAFSYCYALTSMTLQSVTPPEISDDCPFCYTDMNNIVVTVPCNTTETYRNAYIWNEFNNYQEPNTCIYEITATLNYDDAGTVSGAGSYQSGATCTMTATPAANRMFLNWTENGEVVSTESEYSFTVLGDRALVANFSLPTYTITATANPTEGGTVAFMYDFENNTMQGWTTIDADGDGYGWELNYGNTNHGNNGSNGFAFSRSWDNNVILYPDNYLVSPQIILGGSITFYACAQDNGYAAEHFGVAVSTNSNNNPNDFTTIQEWTMSAKGVRAPTDATRSGNRAQGNWYKYTVNLGDYAGQTGYIAIRHFNCWDMFWLNIDDISILPEVATETYFFGSTCTLTATPSYGYTLESWTENGNVVSNDEVYSFTVTGNRDLVANFVKAPFSITATPNFNDRGTVSGAGEYVIDSTCTLTATPAEGHSFVCWLENGEVVSTEAEYTFTVEGPRDLVAVFSPMEGTYIVFADPNVEAICVNHWDTDGDGFLSYDEAAAVTDLGQVFYYNRNITSFDELQYFTGLTFINDYEFIYCQSLTSIIIPESVTSIGYRAFFNCYNLGGILTINENVTYVGGYAFYNTNFSTLNYNAVNCEWNNYSHGYENYSLTSLTIGENVEVIPYAAFQDCYNVTGELVIPNSVTYIGAYAFSGCSGFTSITIPEGITSIEANTFSGCSSVVTINLPSTLENIDEWAFYSCGSLTNVDFPNSVVTIGEGAFQSCSNLASLTLPESLEYIGNQAFYYCSSLTGTLELPANVTYIGNFAFAECSNLTSLVLPENVVSIGNTAFQNCSGLRGEITLPETLESVGSNAFDGCDGISTVNYNATNCQTMGSAGQPVFYDCAFSHLRIGENVENIPDFAFKHCFLINEISTGAIVPPTIYSSTFGMVSRSIPVHVPVGSGEAYRNAPYWEEFFNITEDYTPTNYAYHWNVNANQFENNMNVIGIIQIEGVEQATNTLEIGAFVGDECRGRQFLAEYANFGRYFVFLTLYGEDGDVFSFRLYDHETNTESLLGCTSHITFETNDVIGTPLDPFVFNFTSLQATSFNDGWTWWSTYVEQEGIDGLQMLEEGLGDNGAVIKSQNGFVNNTEGFWYGTLNTLNNETSYMVKTHAATCVDLIGNMVDPSAHPVTLYSGWTWVGYPSMLPMSLEEALSGFEASGGDVLKTQSNGFAYYTENFGWSGSLNTIKPGMGLMYKSNSPANVVFTYPNNTTRCDLKANLTAADNHWVPNLTDYPYNMSVMAVVELDGIEIGSNQYELAAFANGECRGSVRLLFVESLNRYLAFLSIAGEETAELRFALYDSMTGEERFNGDETIPFEANAIVGDVEDPLVIHFRGTTSVDELGSSLQVYPNPATGGEMLYIGMADVDGEVRVETINALGEVVSIQTLTMQAASIKAPSAPGIYLLRITVEGKGTSCHRLIVK